MEAIIKKYFWMANLVFLLMGAWLVASMINVVVAHKLRVTPSLPKHPLKKKRTSHIKKQAENNRVIVDRNYFGSAMAVETTVDDEEIDDGTAAEMLQNGGVESTLRASLVGTIVASDPRWSMALITDLTNSETGAYRNNGTLMEEASVVAILSRKVIVNHNGVIEYLELQEKAGPKRPTKHASRTRTKTQASSLGEGIKKTGENSWAIERAEIDKTLSNLNSIAMQARIVPSFKNGESNGFKLFAIRPGSVYSKLGIQNGDVIHKINGFAINSPERALEIYQKLKSARNVDIELTRRGKNKKLRYNIE